MKFTIGDGVRLRSGGPEMTVSQIDAPDAEGAEFAHCLWFDGAEASECAFDTRTIVLLSKAVTPVVLPEPNPEPKPRRKNKPPSPEATEARRVRMREVQAGRVAAIRAQKAAS